jgi:hypothetical protein
MSDSCTKLPLLFIFPRQKPYSQLAIQHFTMAFQRLACLLLGVVILHTRLIPLALFLFARQGCRGLLAAAACLLHTLHSATASGTD